MIIFYEDQKEYLDDFFLALDKAKLAFKVYDNANELLTFIKDENNFRDITLFVIDIMVFGAGNTFKGVNTLLGYSAGTGLLSSIEKIEKKHGIVPPKKKIIFTNRMAMDFRDLEIKGRVVEILHKSDFLPSEFVSIIKKHI
jgi:hypothetical protein